VGAVVVDGHAPSPVDAGQVAHAARRDDGEVLVASIIAERRRGNGRS